jgi:hypothetical protein
MNHEPVWSVIILLLCGMGFAAYCVIYILLLAFNEMREENENEDDGGH